MFPVSEKASAPHPCDSLLSQGWASKNPLPRKRRLPHRRWYHQKPMDPLHEDDSFQPAALVRTEATALLALADRLEGPMSAAFARAVDLIIQCGETNGRVVVTGMGKSGIIAQKIAATLSSTGSPAMFLHPA